MAVSKPITELQLKAALEPITREVNDLREDQAKSEKKMDELRNLLVGNGEIGMDEIVRDLQKKMDFMIKATYFVFTVIGGYVIVRVIEFLISGIAK